MWYLFIYIFLWSMSMVPVVDEEQSLTQAGKSTERFLQKPADSIPQAADSSQEAGQAANPKAAAKAKNISLPAVLNGLDKKALRLEPLDKLSQPHFHDSVYVLLTAGKISKQLPVFIKLRVIVTDSSQQTRAHDYRLTIDTLGRARRARAGRGPCSPR
jgi:hypothetical protein